LVFLCQNFDYCRADAAAVAITTTDLVSKSVAIETKVRVLMPNLKKKETLKKTIVLLQPLNLSYQNFQGKKFHRLNSKLVVVAKVHQDQNPLFQIMLGVCLVNPKP
jgi:hypothetical protein